MSNTFWTDALAKEYAEHCLRNVRDALRGNDAPMLTIKQFKASKEKPAPLFTTLDGVDIYPGMDYFPVDKSFQILGPWKANEENDLALAHLSAFSTRAAAEAYVLENKPCLSIKEVREVLEMMRPFSLQGDFLSQLSYIVKEKLK